MSRRPLLGCCAALAVGALGVWLAPGALATSHPVAVAGAAGGVTNTSATLTGTIEPSGEAAHWAFQYGTRTDLAGETAVRTTTQPTGTEHVSVTLTGLRPGTEYRYRLLASNSAGTTASTEHTFKTTGLAPPAPPVPAVTTGTPSIVDSHDAYLTGTISPSTTRSIYYFLFGQRLPYEDATLPQTLAPSTAATTVKVPLTGLQGGQTFHYRLVVVDPEAEGSAGIDQTLHTPAVQRVSPAAVEAVATPASQRRLPDVVTVSGRVVLPQGVSGPRACEGFVDITFRVAHSVGIQALRAGLHRDCTYSLKVRFNERRRLRGGRVEVHVLFPGNQLMRRLAAPVRTIQIG